MAFRSFEADVVAVPLDEHGLDVDELERRLAGGLRPKLLYTIPDHQNPAGVSLSVERRDAAGRARAPLRVPRSSRTSPTASSASTTTPRPSLWSLAPGRRRPGRDDVEDVLPRRAARLGGRPGGGLGAARRREAEHRPVRRRARAAAASRSTCAAAGSTSSSCSRGRCTGASASGCSRRSSATCPRACAGRAPEGGFFSWLTLPEGVDAVDLARARRRARASASCPARRSTPDDARRRQRAAVVQHGRRVADRRGHRAARLARGLTRLPWAARVWSDQVPRPGGHTCR